MIIIEGKKYACDTCIKGHRTSSCKHTTRPLFEVQKKGRPVTQCPKCRELRRTKQVHIKCQCEGGKGAKEDVQASKSTDKAHEPAFPAGVPEHLRMSICLLPDTSSDSDQPGPSRHPGPVRLAPEAVSSRSIYPRPPENYSPYPRDPQRSQYVAGVHAPGAMIQAPGRNPYMETSHRPYGVSQPGNSHSGNVNFAGMGPLNMSAPMPDSRQTFWNVPPQENTSQLCCRCGDSCACPGCFEHRGFSEAVQALSGMPNGSGCTNPAICTACMDSSILQLSQTSPADMQSVEQLLRQFSPPPPFDGYPSLSYGTPPLQQMQSTMSTFPSPYANQPVTQYSTREWAYNRFRCCHGKCVRRNGPCGPGVCGCPPGCSCTQEERSTLTYAVSGERDGCRSEKTARR